MNAQTVYSLARAALEVVCASQSYDVNTVIAHREVFRYDDALYNLSELVNLAMDEMQKSKPTGNLYSAMKKLIKAATKNVNANLHGAWIDAEGWMTVCDGHRFIRTKEHFDNLPMAKGVDSSVEIARSARRDSVNTLPLPSVGDLKIHIANCKAENSKFPDYYYELADGYAVDAQYLLEMLSAFPVTECKCGKRNAPYYFCTEENGEVVAEGVLLPARFKKKEETVNA